MAASTAVDALNLTGTIVSQIHSGIGKHVVGRANLRMLLSTYYRRAQGDGELIDSAKNDQSCAYHALHLLAAHHSLLKWLAHNHITKSKVPRTWYKPWTWIKKNRIPFWFTDARATALRKQIEDIEKKGELLWKDIKDAKVKAIEDAKVSQGLGHYLWAPL